MDWGGLHGHPDVRVLARRYEKPGMATETVHYFPKIKILKRVMKKVKPPTIVDQKKYCRWLNKQWAKVDDTEYVHQLESSNTDHE